MNIGFIGLGKLGLPCAEMMAQKNHFVKGYDIYPRKSAVIDVVNSLEECVTDSEIIFVAVPTPHDPKYDGRTPSSDNPPKNFDYTIVESVLRESNRFMRQDQLLVLISTVLPGTTRELFVRLVTNTNFVYNPYLIAMGSVAWDMVNPEMVMIGTENGSETGDAVKLIDFYRTIMENDPRYVIGTWDECECIKVFYNTFISTKLALVNMIQDTAEKIGNINTDVVTDALAKSTRRIMGPQYMTAGMGDGGACHPRDNIALRHLSRKYGLGYDLFESIMRSREQQACNLAQRLVNIARTNNFAKIFIHGKSYKPGVAYIDGSYSLLVGHYCHQLGYPPVYIDPLTGDNLDSAHGVILLAHNSQVTYGQEAAQQQLYCQIESWSVVVDPWRNFVTEDNSISVMYYGNSRKDSGLNL